MSCYPVQFVSRMVMNRSGDIFYIGGNDVLPAPLDPKREAFVLGKLGTDQKEEARSVLIEHNLRLVVYIAKKFDNTGVGVEDLISIGTIGLIKAINTRKNPWTINSLAEIAGRLMFPDEEYIRHTRELICRERDRLYNELLTWDSVTVYEASANFILMKIRKPGITSQDLFDHCIRKGLMIRDCSTFPFLDDHFVRFCVMLPEQNERLLEAFREVLL